jgi:uncharacterized RDD family membrane protein YckC/uncharacterized membrane protein SpoIIM required for sporulation
VPADARLLDTLRAFPTPEHIAFEYRLAGPVARAAAWAIDLLIRVVLFFVLAIPLAMLGTEASQGLILVLVFALDWLSGGLCEWLWRGQTPGKRALGIQVIGVDGLPAGFGACMIRNLLRWADGFPYVNHVPTFGIGLLSLMASGRFQRLGDFAAGTLVIYAERRMPPRQAPPQDPAAKALVERLPLDLPGSLDGRTARAIAAYVARRRQFHPRRRSEMAEHLAGPLRRRFGLDQRIEADMLLVAIYLMLFPTDIGTGRISRAGALAARVLARRRKDWLRLEGILADEPRAPKGAAGAMELGRLYRAACTDLALSEAYHLPLPNQMYLHGLVAQAHLRFYRRLSISWSKLVRLLFIEVPGRLYGDACLRIALFTFFGLFGLCALLRPDLAVTFCGEDSLLNLSDSFVDPPNGRSTGDGASMGGFYIFNNVGISLACFASGIFAGIGSLVWLAFNGIYLGCCFGWMASQIGPERAHFFEFVSAHGPFELTGIALSGAAGMRLGIGLVVRRGLPIAESLVASARLATPVMAVAATFVALAAPIEGWVSPSSLPLIGKRILMVLCGLILLTYLIGFGRRGRRILDQEARTSGTEGPQL